MPGRTASTQALVTSKILRWAPACFALARPTTLPGVVSRRVYTGATTTIFVALSSSLEFIVEAQNVDPMRPGVEAGEHVVLILPSEALFLIGNG